jgi:hypothetical protein
MDWFGGMRSAIDTEETVGLGCYGKTLTVLSSSVAGHEEAGSRRMTEPKSLTAGHLDFVDSLNAARDRSADCDFDALRLDRITSTAPEIAHGSLSAASPLLPPPLRTGRGS